MLTHLAVLILSIFITSLIKDIYVNMIGYVALFLVISSLLTYFFVDEVKDETDN